MPTASFGFSAGAKAANQASLIWTGLGEFSCPGSGPSSAVPVFPATCASGIAPAVPVPLGDHADHQVAQRLRDLRRHHPHRLRMRPELLLDHERRRLAHAAGADRLRDRRHLERGREHLPLADRADAEVEVVADLLGDARLRRGDRVERGAVVELRPLVEAEPLRGLHQPVVADLRPERREDRVARLGECLDEGAAAVLAVGVVDEAPADVDAVGDREGVVKGDHVASAAPRSW